MSRWWISGLVNFSGVRYSAILPVGVRCGSKSPVRTGAEESPRDMPPSTKFPISCDPCDGGCCSAPTLLISLCMQTRYSNGVLSFQRHVNHRVMSSFCDFLFQLAMFCEARGQMLLSQGLVSSEERGPSSVRVYWNITICMTIWSG